MPCLRRRNNYAAVNGAGSARIAAEEAKLAKHTIERRERSLSGSGNLYANRIPSIVEVNDSIIYRRDPLKLPHS
jgi:hypothetical protein